MQGVDTNGARAALLEFATLELPEDHPRLAALIAAVAILGGLVEAVEAAAAAPSPAPVPVRPIGRDWLARQRLIAESRGGVR